MGTTVQLWHAASSSSTPGPLEKRCESVLDDAERQRAGRLRVATARNQHVVGRGMARQLLAGKAVDPRQLQFALQPHGKPYVIRPHAACRPFNVAHTDGLVLCGLAAAEHLQLGVDIERLDRRTDPALAERYFALPEVRILQNQTTEASRRAMFLKIWTLKESFIKAIGTGLQTPLADFAFERLDTDRPTIRFLNPRLHDSLGWHFYSLQPRPGFIAAAAIAIDRPKTEVALEVRQFD